MDPNQYRMFYIRLKSYIASKRGASSRYSTHTVRREGGREREEGGRGRGREREKARDEEEGERGEGEGEG